MQYDQLNKYRPVSAREKRLIAYSSQFQLNVRYLKGSRNYTADCLSRLMDDLDESEVEKWRPSETMKSEDFILALSSEANNPQNFLTHGHKNSKADPETDQPSPNNKSITPVIVDSYSEKHTQGK